MQGQQRLRQPQRLEQHAGVARILGGDNVRARQRLACALAQVAEVADRRRYDLQLPRHTETRVSAETRRKVGWESCADTIIILRWEAMAILSLTAGIEWFFLAPGCQYSENPPHE